MEYKPLEIARILGEPLDPRKPYPDIVNEICEIDTADPDEYVYYFDVLTDVDMVFDITATGAVTSTNVIPDTPVLFNFIDISSPEYYVKITDLAKAKERVLARKVSTINRAMNAYEIRYLMTLIDAAIPAGNTEQLRSGSRTQFSFENLIYMIDMIKDHSDNYTLIAGATIDRDILLWDWTANKYTSLAEALAKLNINIQRVKAQVTVGGVVQDALSSTVAYLVGKNTVIGKPLLYVRKRLNDIELLGGALKQNGEAPERLIFVSPNPITASGGTARFLAIGVTGFEEIVAAVTNNQALAKFNRV